ncbi:AAA family ATPase [Actinosynnema sp. NPDC002837]
MTDDRTLLAGFSVSGFRSLYGDTALTISPLTKVSLLAGQNNSGKSNILSFVARYLNSRERTITAPDGLDVPQTRNEEDRGFRYSIAITENSPIIEAVLTKARRQGGGSVQQFKDFLAAPAFHATHDDLIWLTMNMPSAGDASTTFDIKQLSDLQSQLGKGFLSGLSSALMQTSGGATYDDAKRLISLIDIRNSLPPVQMIGTFRQVDNSTTETLSYDGAGLISSLQRLQNPRAQNRDDRERFNAVNRFVRTVFEDYEATLEVPYDLSTINIARSDSTLPLEHYGTGIQQVIIIATAATVLENHLICIEEPEVNLHPILQRKLLHYLQENTSNQYLIATHSAQMLDYENSSVFSVRRIPSGTEVTTAQTASHVSNICVDLGYRPSDLLQTNAVVWVEGPSDRIYVRHWIDSESNKKLIEGIHYSIMFYGGRLLSSLSTDDPDQAGDVTDFISLRRLNRNVAILIDSDKKSPDAPLNATKSRVVDALSDDTISSFAWVTDGYTIENYVPDKLLRSICSDIYPGHDITGSTDRWSNPLIFRDDAKKKADKVRIARDVCANWDKEHWPIGLQAEVHRLVTMLMAANHITDVDPTLVTSNPPL